MTYQYGLFTVDCPFNNRDNIRASCLSRVSYIYMLFSMFRV